ncbi:nitroreductase family protein [Methanobrevibacter filiformis]|uniref:Coenzyme F420:L-glutamate ligase n=1 Tax=Methanobrevibacter filiformis TaxID=55758 RepID=A0A166CVY4_9EURY|nr:nitroreductase family protein [Methanobrevibacter filiformis]KZX17187.1 coenzyme F420:L-glutamate ligase [Methanobrevibacter filiformis]
MTDIFEVINNRRSVRQYSNEQLKEDEVKKILDAGIMAPTARGEAPWHFTVIQSSDLLKYINETSIDLMLKSDNEFFQAIAKSGRNILHEAPTVIVVSGREDATNIQADCSAAIENILLAAEGLNIGSCWVGLIAIFFEDAENVAKLQIPEGYVPLYGVTLGYKVSEREGNPKRNKNVVNWIK